MALASSSGIVMFSAQRHHLIAFYRGLTGLPETFSDDTVTVLGSGETQIVIHSLPTEAAGRPSQPRDSFVKPIFRVDSLPKARQLTQSLGGRADPVSAEWKGRGFTACEAVDPDGNPIQYRQPAL